MDNKTLGKKGEEIAAQYLQKQGYKILTRNFRYKTFGELDIITKRKGKIVFVEVKTLRQRQGFWPEDEITPKKEKQLRKMAQIYLSSEKLPLDTACQTDIIAIEMGNNDNVLGIRHHQNAIGDY